MIPAFLQTSLGKILVFFVCSAIVTLTMSWAFVRFSNGAILQGGELANREYAELLPLMITGYYAGAVGALVRYCIELNTMILAKNPLVEQLRLSTGFRLFIGGMFGVIGYLLMQSNLLVTLLFDTSKAVGAEVPNVPVSVAGVLIVGFFVGVFSSEVFGKLKSRFDTDKDK